MQAADSPRGSIIVTVIVLNWNGKHLLVDCLQSLIRQTFRDFETILIDNGSTDGSAEWVATHYPDVRLIPLKMNLGFAGGNNVGINLATGQYIVLLNNDTEVEPNWLEQLYAHICTDDRIAACDSKVLYFDRRDTIWTSGGTYSIAGTTTFRWQMQKDSRDLHQPADVFVAGACSAMYRKSVLKEIGLLDEDFFIYFEDVDWSFRAHLRGYRIINVPASRVYHKVSSTVQYHSALSVYLCQRNVSAVFIKNMPSPLLLRYWPLHLAYMLGSLAYFSKIGNAKAFMKAKIRVLREMPVLLQKRKRTQKMRTVSAEAIDSLLDRAWLGPKIEKYHAV